MKKNYIILIVLGCLSAFIGLILAAVFYATSGITDTADEFFASARQGDYAAAHGLTSQSLQNECSVDRLTGYLEENGLNKVVDTSWSSRSVKNGEGELAGSLEIESGGTIPIVIKLVSEGDVWKINYMDVEQAGLKTSGKSAKQATNGPVPEPAVVLNLARFHTGLWAEAVRRNDYEYFAEFWQGIDAAELKEAFSETQFTDEELKQFEVARPTVNSAEILDNGNLAIEAEFDIETQSIRTRYQFAKSDGELRDWEVAGLNVDFRRN